MTDTALSFPSSRDSAAAPAHLSEEMAAWWGEVVRDFDLDGHHLRLLQHACEAWDIAQAARVVLDEEGCTYLDRFGQPKPRPEAGVWRDNASLFARLIRELQLDNAPPDSRPPRMS